MKEQFYTNERGHQIVIALLKAHGIRKVIASPGTTNFTFVASLQQDPWFEMYSSIDERSAAYIACGMAAESGEPVVITCTGATASRNYMSGLTEAYYRKLPIIAVTGTQGNGSIGHLIEQNVDRRVLPNDIALCSVYVPKINTAREERIAMVDVNKALLECKRRGGGPVHINLQTAYSGDFSVKELPPVRVINRITCKEEFPVIPQGRVVIYVGCHAAMSKDLTEAIDKFCATYDAAVFCDHNSGYRGKYKVVRPLIGAQKQCVSPTSEIDTLVHIGEISGEDIDVRPKYVWRVSEDGELRDPFRKLRYVFEMDELTFFSHYATEGGEKDSFLKECLAEYKHIYEKIPELPFSNVWMAQQMSKKIPEACVMHFGILNSLRSWKFFELPSSVRSYCNVGGYGIDGGVSSMIGASLASPNKIFFGIFGDLAFFYDLNSLGNRHVGKNLRIMLVNNGLGVEFKVNPASVLGERTHKFIAAQGHYGNQSPALVRHYAEDLGFRYLCASTKEEFLSAMEEFTNPKMCAQSIIFECFTTPENDAEAVQLMRHIVVDKHLEAKKKTKETVKSIIGESATKKIKSFIRG